jgi:hypothetical protein
LQRSVFLRLRLKTSGYKPWDASPVSLKKMADTNKKWLRNFMLAVIGLLVGCGLAVALFVNWANQPENQAAALAARTAEANQNATQSAQLAQDTAAATEEMQQIAARLAQAKPVFHETFEANSPFLTQNLGDLSVSMRAGIPAIAVPFNRTNFWMIGQELGDFVAELDCEPAGDGTFCGVAFGLNPKDTHPNGTFYASFTGSGGRCGFADNTGSFIVSRDWDCAPPKSPAAGFLNRLRVERFGPHLRFYVNGQLMDERVLPADNARSGGVGLYFGCSGDCQSGVFHVLVDTFNVWELPK